MGPLTIGYGVLLILLGFGGFVLTGSHAPTALIPAAFGVLVVLCGLLARRDAWRRQAMHAAALLALLGLVGTIGSLPSLPAALSGGAVIRPAAVISRSIMAILSLIFLVLCIKSFVDARRRRPSQPGAGRREA